MVCRTRSYTKQMDTDSKYMCTPSALQQLHHNVTNTLRVQILDMEEEKGPNIERITSRQNEK